jgi:hypothetical protein
VRSKGRCKQTEAAVLRKKKKYCSKREFALADVGGGHGVSLAAIIQGLGRRRAIARRLNELSFPEKK